MASERTCLARNLAPAGQGSGGSGRAGWGLGAAESGNSFPFPHSPPLSLGAHLSELWETENEMLIWVSSRPFSSPWPSGFGARVGAQ